jgi:P27 family predicted phage terminase small subunit
MGRRGPKKMPRGLTRIRDEHLPPEAQPTSAARTPPPKWLSREAKAEWHRIEPELSRLGLLTILDLSTFAGYCQAYGRWQRCEQLLARLPSELVKAKRRDYHVQVHPLVKMVRAAVETMNRLGAQFGLSPSARAGLSMPLDPTAPNFRNAQPPQPAGPKPDDFDFWLQHKRGRKGLGVPAKDEHEQV